MSMDFQTVVRSVRDLPPMPAVAIRVLELLGNEDVSYQKLSEVISSDPAVSARLLKVANSAFYSMKRQIKTLDHAIAVVGERTLRSLVLAASLEGMNKSYGLLEKLLWEDAIGCAIASRIVARKFSSADPEEAFLAGLFRHLGKIVMNFSDPETYRALVEAAYAEGSSTSAMEGRFFPYAHEVVGAAVLNKWNFSQSLVTTVLHHSDLKIHLSEEEEGRQLVRLAATVNLAGHICMKLGIGQREARDQIDVSLSPGAQALELTEDQVISVLDEVDETFKQNREFFIG